jgi:hypothetical protein
MGPQDYERLAPLEAKLVEELEIFVGEVARQREWALPDSPRVSFATDERLAPGEFRVAADAVALERPVPRRSTPRTSPRVDVEDEAPSAQPCLVLLDDDQVVRTIPIGRRARIGRQADNDLVLTDPGVSRHHAEITSERGTCTLRDLGSTNGTLVNGTRVSEHALRDGDRIQIGSSVVEFRRD